MMARSLRSRSRAARWLAVADVLAFVLALMFALGLLLLFRHERIGGDLLLWFRTDGALQIEVFGLLQVYCLLRFWAQGAYRQRQPFWDELRDVAAVLLMAALLHVVILVSLKGTVSRFLVPVLWLLLLLLIPLLRALMRALLRASGHWQLPVIIIGCGRNALAARQALASEPALGFAVRHCVQLVRQSEAVIAGAADIAPVSPSGHALPRTPLALPEAEVLAWLQQQGEIQLLIALEPGEYEQHVRLIEQLVIQRPNAWLVPPLTGLPLLGMSPRHFFRHDVLLLGLNSNLNSLPRRLLKRVFDLLAGTLALLLLSPFLLLLAALVRLDGGPALFAQTRIGRRGRPFRCLKFRTMLPDAEQRMQALLEQDAAARAEWQASRKLRRDPRITRLGAWLRRTSLDELPQLWNVIRGDMSLVGPRPVVDEELACYGDKADLYCLVRPGLTGLWQVSGRSDTSYGERVALDAWYIRNWSLWYDIAILCKTVVVLCRRQGAY